ncbi:MAG: DUF4397 domain-containing protein [Candidatus Sumerlaeia bacterium]|nr:DUF4397 domain-containing protein [Candidatus Sumerlaeia bacterium]
MKQISAGFLAAGMSLALVGFAGADPEVRVVHLSPDAPAVDVFVNGTRAITEREFPSSSAFVPLTPGNYDFVVTPADADISTEVLSFLDVDLATGNLLTAVAYDSLAEISGLAFVEDRDGLDPGNTRVRAVHTATGVGTVDILNITDRAARTGPVLFGALEFGSASSPQDLPADSYTVGLDIDQSGTAEYIFDLPGLPAGELVNAYAVNDNGSVFLLAQLESGATIAIPPAITDLEINEFGIRVLHLSPDAPNVDVFANSTGPVVSDLPFPAGTSYLAVEEGSYTFQVSATGTAASANVLEIGPATLNAGIYYTAAAIRDLANISGVVLVDDYTTPATGEFGLRVIHAGEGVPGVDVYALDPGSFTIDGAPLVPGGLELGEFSSALALPEGAYRVGLDVGQNGSIDVAFNLPYIPAGSVANAYAVNDDGTVFLLIQLNDNLTSVVPAQTPPTAVSDWQSFEY